MEEISALKREGLSILAISELTGFDRKTIRKYLLKPEARPVYGPRSAPMSKLDGFKPYLEERLKAGVWNARVLLRELRERGYMGSYTILTDWLRPQRTASRVIAVRRFETPPGKQAQVDWGHLGSITGDGEQRPLWGELIARHVPAARVHQVITCGEHHQGIPLGNCNESGKTLIHIRQSAPSVEQRSLAAYEALVAGGTQ